MSRHDTVLLVDPVNPVYERDFLFDARAGEGVGDDVNGAWRFLREYFAALNVRVHTADLLASGEVPPAERYAYISAGARTRYRRLASRSDVDALAFFVFECPIVEPRLYDQLDDVDRHFDRLYSYSDAVSLRPFLRKPLEFHEFRLPQPFERVHEDAWSRRDRGFMVMINANKLPRLYVNELYTERLRAVEYFERSGEIDLYGVGWDGPPYQMGETPVPATLRRMDRAVRTHLRRVWPSRDPLRIASLRAYKGKTAAKAETLSRYTFAVCFENMVLPGWVTEKIFDCLLAGTIPIYLGASDIERWVPKECFVDMRSFESYDELREHLRSLSAAQIQGYREAGRAYIGSPQYAPFAPLAFAREIHGLMNGAPTSDEGTGHAPTDATSPDA